MAKDKTNGLSNVNNLSNNATFNPMLSSSLREFFSIAWTEKTTLFQRPYHIRHNRMPISILFHDFSFKFLFFHGW
ncbi:hypothetical protein [Helicobacter pylori]|uniref:hypothetical protein n=1 Tax=Helicobacter pylori TaxID=210 RepID=UPI001362CB96|nr:hypothetical protein [Helicobacter pylori]